MSAPQPTAPKQPAPHRQSPPETRRRRHESWPPEPCGRFMRKRHPVAFGALVGIALAACGGSSDGGGSVRSMIDAELAKPAPGLFRPADAEPSFPCRLILEQHLADVVGGPVHEGLAGAGQTADGEGREWNTTTCVWHAPSGAVRLLVAVPADTSSTTCPSYTGSLPVSSKAWWRGTPADSTGALFVCDQGLRVELHQLRGGLDESALLNAALRLMPDALDELGLAAAVDLPDSMRLDGN